MKIDVLRTVYLWTCSRTGANCQRVPLTWPDGGWSKPWRESRELKRPCTLQAISNYLRSRKSAAQMTCIIIIVVSFDLRKTNPVLRVRELALAARSSLVLERNASSRKIVISK